jgi:hypothetical protein
LDAWLAAKSIEVQEAENEAQDLWNFVTPGERFSENVKSQNPGFEAAHIVIISARRTREILEEARENIEAGSVFQTEKWDYPIETNVKVATLAARTAGVLQPLPSLESVYNSMPNTLPDLIRRQTEENRRRPQSHP